MVLGENETIPHRKSNRTNLDREITKERRFGKFCIKLPSGPPSPPTLCFGICRCIPLVPSWFKICCSANILDLWVGKTIDVIFTFKRSPRSLIFVEIWWSYKNIQVHYYFQYCFYCFVFVNICPNNMFLGSFWTVFFRTTEMRSGPLTSWTWTYYLGPVWVRTRVCQVQDWPLDSLLWPCQCLSVLLYYFIQLVSHTSGWPSNLPKVKLVTQYCTISIEKKN